MGFAGLVSFSHNLQRREPRLTAITTSLITSASPVDANYCRRTAAFAHQGVTGGYADWQHPHRRDPDCMVVVDAELTDRTRLERKLYGTPIPLAATAEVVLHAYRQWGAKLTDHLQGEFSIAIWDAVLQRLLLIRDPLGNKAVSFVNYTGGLAFATQATALLAYCAGPASAEHQGLSELVGVQPTRTPRCGVQSNVQELVSGELVQLTPTSLSRGLY